MPKTPNKAREELIRRLRKTISKSTLALWVEPGEAVRIEDNRLVLAFPERQFVWVSRHYAPLLGEAARLNGLDGVRIVQRERSAA